MIFFVEVNVKGLLISELAKAVGLHPETLRRLERKGLITSERDLNGWRRFDSDVAGKIRRLYAVKQPGDKESSKL